MTTVRTEPPAEAARARVSARGQLSRFLQVAPALTLIGLLIAAVVVFACKSLSASPGGQLGVSGALRAGALNGFFWSAMAHTVLLSLVAAALSCLVSVLVADALVTIDRPAVTAAMGVLLISPLVVSLAVRGYGWLLVLDQRWVADVINALGTVFGHVQFSPRMIATVLVLAHAITPLTAFPILTRRREIENLNITRAARDLGAGDRRVLLWIVAPLATPTVLRVGALAFGLSMGAFGIPSIIGNGRVQVVSEILYQNLLITDWSSAFLQLVALLAVTGAIVVPLFRAAALLGARNAVHAGGAG